MSTDFQIVYSGFMDEFPAKGSLMVGLGSGLFRLLAVGADGTVPVADSTAATGITWGTVGGGGGPGAPTNAQYVVISLDATLTDERRLQVNSTHLSLVDAGANADVTLSIADNGVTFAKMQDISTGTLIGRTTAGTGDPEEITPGVGMSMALGQLIVATNGVSNAKIRQSEGLSVIGRSANTTGNVADITAGTDAYVLRRSGTTIGFGQVATGGITDAAVTLPKLANLAASTLIGRDSTGTGVPQAITLGTGLSMSAAGVLSSSGSGTVMSLDVQTFSSSGTWNKPAGATSISVYQWGGGGGGGSGRNATSNNRGGGGGAHGGCYSEVTLLASQAGSTETVTVGAAGVGGPGPAVGGLGVAGTAGGESSFGSWCRASGGQPGGAGTTTAGPAAPQYTTSNDFYAFAQSAGATAGSATGAPSAATPASNHIAPGAGAGGAGTAGSSAAGAAGSDGAKSRGGAGSGGAGGAAASNGTDGADGSHSLIGGGGGGSGGSSGTGPGGRGGHGGFPGGGGGGGGGGSGGTNGDGGNGGGGYVVVVTLCVN